MHRPFVFLVRGAANEDRPGEALEPLTTPSPVVYVVAPEDVLEVRPRCVAVRPPPPPADAEEAGHG